MKELLIAPYFIDDPIIEKYRKSMKNWSRKLDRLDDEMLIYVRERVNYLLEKRSMDYMEALERKFDETEQQRHDTLSDNHDANS